MKNKSIFMTFIMFLVSFAQAQSAVLPESVGSSRCYYIANPVVYGNPIVGKVEDFLLQEDIKEEAKGRFREGSDLENSRGCFNILKWMVLPQDESYIGEFGTFYFKNSDTDYARVCKYEVQATARNDVFENLKEVLVTAHSYEELLARFDERKQDLDQAVTLTCDIEATK